MELKTEHMKEWLQRPLKSIYPIVYINIKSFSVRQNDLIIVKKIYAALAYDLEGISEFPGVWLIDKDTDCSKIFDDLKHRGVRDILIIYIDNPSGLESSIKDYYPHTDIQSCVIQQIKSSVRFALYKDRKWIQKEIKQIYEAPDEEHGLETLNQFISRWENKYAYLGSIWKNNWKSISGIYKYPDDIRKLIYNTNFIDNFNSSMERPLKLKSLFLSEEDILMLYYQGVINMNKKRQQKLKSWNSIIQGLLNHFQDRLLKHISSY